LKEAQITFNSLLGRLVKMWTRFSPEDCNGLRQCAAVCGSVRNYEEVQRCAAVCGIMKRCKGAAICDQPGSRVCSETTNERAVLATRPQVRVP